MARSKTLCIRKCVVNYFQKYSRTFRLCFSDSLWRYFNGLIPRNYSEQRLNWLQIKIGTKNRNSQTRVSVYTRQSSFKRIFVSLHSIRKNWQTTWNYWKCIEIHFLDIGKVTKKIQTSQKYSDSTINFYISSR